MVTKRITQAMDHNVVSLVHHHHGGPSLVEMVRGMPFCGEGLVLKITLFSFTHCIGNIAVITKK